MERGQDEADGCFVRIDVSALCQKRRIIHARLNLVKSVQQSVAVIV